MSRPTATTRSSPTAPHADPGRSPAPPTRDHRTDQRGSDRRPSGAPAIRPVLRQRRLADLRRHRPQPHPRRRAPRRRHLDHRPDRDHPHPDHHRRRPPRAPGPHHPTAPTPALALAGSVRQPVHHSPPGTRLTTAHRPRPSGPTTGHEPSVPTPERPRPEQADHVIGDLATPRNLPIPKLLNRAQDEPCRWIQAEPRSPRDVRSPEPTPTGDQTSPAAHGHHVGCGVRQN